MKSDLILRMPYNFYQSVAGATELWTASSCLQWSRIRDVRESSIKESSVELAKIKSSS